MGAGKIVVISGPSGVGKTTLYKKLLGEFHDRLGFSVSVTTRPKRDNEQDGVDYHFIGEKEFMRKVKNSEFVEWAIVYNNYYGTLRSEIERIVSGGRNCLMDLDVQGGLNMKKAFADSILVFIFPPSIEVLKERITRRKTESPEALQIRIEHSIREIECAGTYDFRVVNDNFDHAYSELKAIISGIIEKQPQQ